MGALRVLLHRPQGQPQEGRSTQGWQSWSTGEGSWVSDKSWYIRGDQEQGANGTQSLTVHTLVGGGIGGRQRGASTSLVGWRGAGLVLEENPSRMW